MGQYDFRAIMTRRAEWKGDVLQVHDTIRDVVNGLEQEIESAVLNHFDMDFTDLREYLRDKEEWKRKQAEAIPRWIPVTERKPFAEYGESDAVLTVDSLGEMRVACWDGGNWVLTNGNFIESTMKFPITHWMPLPEPPKGEGECFFE